MSAGLMLRRSTRYTAVMAALTVIVAGQPAVAAPPGQRFGWSLPALQKDWSVPVRAVPARALPEDTTAKDAITSLPPPVWPAATVAEVSLVDGTADPKLADGMGVQVRAEGTPITVARAKATARDAKGGARVRVRVAEHAAATALGRQGVVFSVGDVGAGAGQVRVSVDYRSFATATGGDYGNRLRLVELPACALSTPDKPECRTATPLANSTNDIGKRTLSADVSLDGVAARVLAAAPDQSGSGGDVSVAPLSAAGSWTAGSTGGGFAFSYPFSTPPGITGEHPNLAMAYSSAALDGLTSATNNQPSWVGDGWDFTPGGYVQRQYQSCGEDLGGNNGQTKTGDQCWGPDNATLVLGGVATELVSVPGTNRWRAKHDDGAKVELLTGADNGAWQGQHWKVTTLDGTQYFLGLNHPPGWTSGKPATESAFTVPVFGNNSGEPCFKSNDYAGSWCRQAWRWNLDYTVDPHGNVATYYYQQETNYYGLNRNNTGPGTSYTSGGYPLRMEYGLRLDNGSIYRTEPVARVTFDTAERCIPTETFDCDPAKLKIENATRWPDVPFDTICAGSKCLYGSPSFFSRKRLSAVHSQVRTGTGTFTDADSWTLQHAFPGSGDASPAALWLSGITHTGGTGSSAITLPTTMFTGFILPNRVDTVGDKYSPLTRRRLTGILNETGGYIGVAYSGQDCQAGTRMPASPETDTMRCYASYWSPPEAKDPVRDWFHKYVVTDVTQDDRTGGSVPVKTHYDYLGDAAWHYDQSQFTPEKRKTWSQWRGYETVRTTVGEPSGTQTVTEDLYMRGMDGDRLPNGTRQRSVEDSEHGTLQDQDPLQGFLRESRTYLVAGGAVQSASINDPWLVGPTATSSDGLLKAYKVDTASVRGRTLLSAGSYRRTRVNKDFNDKGLVTRVEDLGDTAVTGDETCTKTDYLANPDSWMQDRASEVTMFGATCAGQHTAANNITNVRSSYDGKPFGTSPTVGDVTRIEILESWDAAGRHFIPVLRNEFDKYGRETSSTDELDRVIGTKFTPETGGPVTGTTVTNPLGWQTITTLDPGRGYPTAMVDANGVRTDITYDALGRKTAVWNPGRSKPAGESPSATFVHSETQTQPTSVATKALQDNGNYLTSYALFDGLGRVRQTQSTASGGGRIVSDTVYDSRGLPFKTNNAYFNADSGPSGTLVTAADNQVPNQTVSVFDGMARPTESSFYKLGVAQWRTGTIYGGDRTTTIPPPGGSPQTVVTDVQGSPIKLLQYSNGYTPGGANPADVSTYTYNAGGALTSMTDSSNNTWTYRYDLRGRQISQTDPDTGTATTTYDAAGQILSTTDGRGQSLFFSYDKLGRRIRVNAGSPTGTKLATWTYDTVPHGIGKPTSSTRWIGTAQYTKSILSYDDYGRPTNSAVDIPAAEGALSGRYEFGVAYTPTGRVASTTSPEAGGLPRETIVHKTSDIGLPTTTYAVAGNGAITDLVSQTDYTSYNEVTRTQLDAATAPSNVWITQTYEDGTRRPQTTTVDRATQVDHELAKVTYGFDPAGKLTKIADQPSGASSDVQCFDYDYLQRMTEAWTPASGNCAATKSMAGLGGAAPFWHTFSFDKTGNRKQQVVHTSAGNVTSNYSYPNSGPNSVRPHALSSVTTTGPHGTASNSYTYNATGDLESRNVGGDTQTFSYDAEGRTATATDRSGTSRYIYDADGNRLITRDPTGTTLMVDDLELVQAAGSTTVTGTRFYQHGGSIVAERSANGLKWMMADHHDTNGLAIAAGNLTPTWRYSDPFGNSRGTPPAAWPDKHGFVGGYQDSTGLTHLGAREYDPATGRFTQPDPELETEVPQLWNAYAYANNAPANLADPSGLSPCFNFGEDGMICYKGTPGCEARCQARGWLEPPAAPSPGAVRANAAANYAATHGVDQAKYQQAKAFVQKSKWHVFLDAAGDLLSGLLGIDDLKECIGHGAFGACVMTLINIIPWGKLIKSGKEIVESFWKGAKALLNFSKDMAKAEKVIVDTERVMVDAQRAGMQAERLAIEAEQAAAKEAKAAAHAKAGGHADSSGGRSGGNAAGCADRSCPVHGKGPIDNPKLKCSCKERKRGPDGTGNAQNEDNVVMVGTETEQKVERNMNTGTGTAQAVNSGVKSVQTHGTTGQTSPEGAGMVAAVVFVKGARYWWGRWTARRPK